jgi:hypothetical protein
MNTLSARPTASFPTALNTTWSCTAPRCPNHWLDEPACVPAPPPRLPTAEDFPALGGSSLKKSAPAAAPRPRLAPPPPAREHFPSPLRAWGAEALPSQEEEFAAIRQRYADRGSAYIFTSEVNFAARAARAASDSLAAAIKARVAAKATESRRDQALLKEILAQYPSLRVVVEGTPALPIPEALSPAPVAKRNPAPPQVRTRPPAPTARPRPTHWAKRAPRPSEAAVFTALLTATLTDSRGPLAFPAPLPPRSPLCGGYAPAGSKACSPYVKFDRRRRAVVPGRRIYRRSIRAFTPPCELSCLQKTLKAAYPSHNLRFTSYESRPVALFTKMLPANFSALDHEAVPVYINAACDHVSISPFEGSLRRTTHDLFLTLSLGTFHAGETRMESIDRSQYYVANINAMPMRPELANVAPVPSEYLISSSPNTGEALVDLSLDSSFPEILTIRETEIVRPAALPGYFTLSIPTTFKAHSPDRARSFPDEFTEEFPLVILGTAGSVGVAVADRLPVRVPSPMCGEIFLPRQPKPLDQISLRYSGLIHLAEGDNSKRAKETIDSILAPFRMVGANIPRTIPNFEGVRQQMYFGAHALFSYAKPGQQYLRLAFRMLSMYMEAMTYEHLNATMPTVFANRHRRYNAAATSVLPLSATQIRYLGTDAVQTKGDSAFVVTGATAPAPPGAGGVPGAPGVPGLITSLAEAGLWDPTANVPHKLSCGKAAFVDARAMTPETLRIVLSCLLPKDGNNAINVYTAHDNAQANNFQFWSTPYSDIRFPGVPEIFIHWGDRPAQDTIPYGDLVGSDRTVIADPYPSQNPWPAYVDQHPLRGVYSSFSIQVAIQHMIANHHCAGDFKQALDMITYRMFSPLPQASPAMKTNAQRALVFSSGGTDLRLPLDITLPAYFDVAWDVMPMPDSLNRFFATPAKEVLNAAYFPNYHALAALNWPSHTFTIRGQQLDELAARPLVTNATKDSRTHLNTHFDTPRRDMNNRWTVAVLTAMSTMYGYSPSPLTALCGPQRPVNDWQEHCSIYYVNPYAHMHMARCFPHHMLLPDLKSTIVWPEDQPAPMSHISDNDREFRVGRATPKYKGFNWVQDGAMEYSIRHLLALPSANGELVSDPHIPAHAGRQGDWEIGHWHAPFQHKFPVTPSFFDPIFMGPPGTHWGNFIVPGSCNMYDLRRNRVKALGARVKDSVSVADLRAIKRDNNAMLGTNTTPAQGGLPYCISVMGADGRPNERESANEYVTATIYNNANVLSAFAMTLKADAIESQNNFQYTLSLLGDRPMDATRWPAYLANDNNPEVPRPRARARRSDFFPANAPPPTPPATIRYDNKNPNTFSELPPLNVPITAYPDGGSATFRAQAPPPTATRAERPFQYGDSHPEFVARAWEAYAAPPPVPPPRTLSPTAPSFHPQPVALPPPQPATVLPPAPPGRPSRPTPINRDEIAGVAYPNSRALPTAEDFIRAGVVDPATGHFTVPTSGFLNNVPWSFEPGAPAPQIPLRPAPRNAPWSYGKQAQRQAPTPPPAPAVEEPTPIRPPTPMPQPRRTRPTTIHEEEDPDAPSFSQANRPPPPEPVDMSDGDAFKAQAAFRHLTGATPDGAPSSNPDPLWLRMNTPRRGSQFLREPEN